MLLMLFTKAINRGSFLFEMLKANDKRGRGETDELKEIECWLIMGNVINYKAPDLFYFF